MADITDSELLASRIAREVARDLVPVDTIRARFKLTEDEYAAILHSPIFKVRLEEELAVWSASDAMSAVERIKAKASVVVEESLIEVYALIHDKNEPMAAKVRALEWVSGMAGLNDMERLGSSLPAGVVSGGGSGVNFNIYIGGEKQSFTVNPNQPKLVEGEVVLNDKEVTGSA